MKRRHSGLAAVAMSLIALSGCGGDAASEEAGASEGPAQTQDQNAVAPSERDLPVPEEKDWPTAGFLSGARMNPDAAQMTLSVLPVSSTEEDFKADAFVMANTAAEAGWPTSTLPSPTCSPVEAALVRDGNSVVTGPGCNIRSGLWVDPFSGDEVESASAVTALHVVPDEEVWRAGAADWTEEQFRIYSSSPTSLLAALPRPQLPNDGTRLAGWRPRDEARWCTFAIRWVEVKNEFGLSLTSAEERDLLAQMLDSCTAKGQEV